MTRAGRAASVGVALLLCACGEGDLPAGAVLGPRVEAKVRPDTPGNNLQFSFEPGDVVEVFDSAGGEVRVHYTEGGPNAVPNVDADVSGVPDFVEQVAGVYDEVIVHYRDGMGFRPPVKDDFIADNGGSDRFDVYLVDFAGVGDGAFQADKCLTAQPDQCAGYMVQENDYKGYGYPSKLIANRILGSHEFFHAVQAAYDNGQSSIANEGTAVWATEMFDPSLTDFEAFLPGFFDNCDRSLDTPLPGPVDPFSYGSAIFFWFLEERYGEGTVRTLWELVENGAGGVADPDWYDALDALAQTLDTTFADAYVEFSTYNLFTADHADPTRGYAAGAGYYDWDGGPIRVKTVPAAAPFADEQLRLFHASAHYFTVPPDGRTTITAALVAPAEAPDATEGLTLLLVADDGDKYGDVMKVADPTAGAETVDATGAEQIVVAVVNGNRTGDSKKPGLCIGSPEEVTACIAQLGGGAGGEGGSGGADGAGGHGGSAPAAPTEKTDSDDGGCSCRTTAPARTEPILFVGALAALAAARRRRARGGH